jgi:hypothetical protein
MCHLSTLETLGDDGTWRRSREPPAADLQNCNGTKRLPSRRWAITTPADILWATARRVCRHINTAGREVISFSGAMERSFGSLDTPQNTGDHPYQNPLRYERSLDSLARPSQLQSFPPILQRDFLGHNFFHLNPPVLEVVQGALKRIDLRE